MTDKQLIETRASILWWFSTILSNELTVSQFNSHLNQQGALLLDQLACDPELNPHVHNIKQSLAKLNLMQHPHLECAVEFTQLFLMDMRKGAPPCASVYLSKDGLMFQQTHQDMIKLLENSGLAVNSDFNEPADHVAILLDYLGNIVLAELKAPDNKEAIAKQLDFIETKLLNWLPLLIKQMRKTENSGFYQGIAELLNAYLILEQEMLKEDISA